MDVLQGFGLGADGKLHYTQLPLGDHLENDDGILRRKANGNFQWIARNINLDSDWNISLDLERYDHTWNLDVRPWEITAQWVFVNPDGSLGMDDP